MKRLREIAVCGASALLLSGCTLFSRGGDGETPTTLGLTPPAVAGSGTLSGTAESEGRVVNPPVKTIRFDGREIVLGTAEMKQVATDQFCTELRSLLEQEKHFSASLLISKNRDVAEQAIWERCIDASNQPLVPFTAGVLSREIASTISWDSLLVTLAAQPADGRSYHQARAQFLSKLKREEPSDQDAEQLRVVAQRLNHPLVMADALRLMGLRELVAARHAWAESLFLQGAEIAEQHQDSARAAEFWMMAATTANRAGRASEAATAWGKAVQRQLDVQLASQRPLNVYFWTRVEEQRPIDAAWPARMSEALAPLCRSVGCQISAESPAELVLWCAVAVGQYEDAQPQLALVNFKRAERATSGEDVMWLRIAQSKCLAALGQSHAAAALLSGPAASSTPAVALAAAAAIGSAKLQAGAYQQGTQLINKALQDAVAVDWPTRSQAEADLALAQLIIGDTDQGLKSLHTVQSKFQMQGDYVSLLQSLENELRILQLEGRTEEAKEIQLRIRSIEEV